MADCTNEAMRDLLPLLAWEEDRAGAEAGLASARSHVESCAECAAELALLRAAASAIDARVPRVDAAAISAGVRRAMRVRIVERRAPSRWMPRRQAAMAASLILMVSASLAVLARTFGGPADASLNGGRATSAMIDSAPVARVSASAGITVAGGLSDLSEEELVTLLAALEEVEATVDAEPQSIRRSIVDVPEEF
jgi:hypothetical protein